MIDPFESDREDNAVGERFALDDEREIEPIEEMDLRTSGTFAEGQQRLANALDMFTQRLMVHLEQK